MTSSVDPVRQVARLRRLRRQTDQVHASAPQEHPNLPVLAPQTLPGQPAPSVAAGGPAIFTAHVIGEGEQKRGLRGGPPTLNAARSAYTQTEYSGRADRRARKGGLTRTEI